MSWSGRFRLLVHGILVFTPLLPAETAPGLQKPVEVLRDRWGVPHIYASNQHDLFFAQGYIAAKDRLFQIDLWRRAGSGKLAEVLGPSAIHRDRLARAVSYRGNWDAEWKSYGADTKAIVTAFVDGVNAYVRSVAGKRPAEFQKAGYDPGLWAPEDCLSRVAGLLMTRNLTREVTRSLQIAAAGLPAEQKYFPPDPPVAIDIPKGLDLGDVTPEILRVYNETIVAVPLSGEQGSNNWVVDGTMTTTGRPMLANDPHRPVQLPSLRKTVHLVAPGWNAIGAGEPALPGIAIGHNERIAFGITIVGIDQQDLYIEKLNPANAAEYRYRGAWKKVEIERQKLRVKGREDEPIELRFTIHGPMIYEDRARSRAYVVRWVGTEPGGAGYLAGLPLSLSRNWPEFQAALAAYKVPSENVVYADTDGNIGWQAAGLAPVRENWSGMLPVPGDSGEYEWRGFRKSTDLPSEYNPPRHFIATANNNILPPDYPFALGFEWALPFRVNRIREMLTTGKKFDIADFERMQQDVTSLPARRFLAILRQWHRAQGSREAAIVDELVKWDGVLRVDSHAALIYEVWLSQLPAAVFGAEIGATCSLEMLLKTLEARPNPQALASSLTSALGMIEKGLGANRADWRWGRIHEIYFRHPLGVKEWNLGPVSRPGDANTVNATSGPGFRQASGASYRQIMDVGNWDNSVMTNVPGESGNPGSRHYSDLINDWAAGRYHPMPFSRKAVEAATEERIELKPN